MRTFTNWLRVGIFAFLFLGMASFTGLAHAAGFLNESHKVIRPFGNAWTLWPAIDGRGVPGVDMVVFPQGPIVMDPKTGTVAAADPNVRVEACIGLPLQFYGLADGHSGAMAQHEDRKDAELKYMWLTSAAAMPGQTPLRSLIDQFGNADPGKERRGSRRHDDDEEFRKLDRMSKQEIRNAMPHLGGWKVARRQNKQNQDRLRDYLKKRGFKDDEIKDYLWSNTFAFEIPREEVHSGVLLIRLDYDQKGRSFIQAVINIVGIDLYEWQLRQAAATSPEANEAYRDFLVEKLRNGGVPPNASRPADGAALYRPGPGSVPSHEGHAPHGPGENRSLERHEPTGSSPKGERLEDKPEDTGFDPNSAPPSCMSSPTPAEELTPVRRPAVATKPLVLEFYREPSKLTTYKFNVGVVGYKDGKAVDSDGVYPSGNPKPRIYEVVDGRVSIPAQPGLLYVLYFNPEVQREWSLPSKRPDGQVNGIPGWYVPHDGTPLVLNRRGQN